jgi:hypothetical protein
MLRWRSDPDSLLGAGRRDPDWRPAPELDAVTPSSIIRLWAIPAGAQPIAVDGVTANGNYPAVAATRNSAVLMWVDGTKIMFRRVVVKL